jgi:hypothetical protein
MRVHLSALGTLFGLPLLGAALFTTPDQAQAQGMGMMGPPMLRPASGPFFRPTVALLNNGSLQTSANPNAKLPNQIPFIYIAAMPLGDRLGNNGVFYDTGLLPNLGLFAPQGMGGNPMPNPPPKGANFSRQFPGQDLTALYMQQMMMSGYGFGGFNPYATFGAYNPYAAFGAYNPYTAFGGYQQTAGFGLDGLGGFGGFGGPALNPFGANNAGFGAGFAPGNGGF